jgi:peptidase S41-like protein
MLGFAFAATLAASPVSRAAPVPRLDNGVRRDTTQSGDTSCVAALDSLVRVLRRDYPGYRDRVVGHEGAFAMLVDSVRSVAAAPAADTSYQVCIPALQRVTRFFRDAHLMLWQGPAPVVAPEGMEVVTPAAAPPTAVPPDDPDRPALRRYDTRTLILRLPDLDMRYEPVVDSLVAARWAELTATPTLVIDLRGNGGGCTCTYDALLPLVATGPIASDQLDVWASSANVAYFRALASDAGTPDTLRAELRRLLPRLADAPNTFVAWDADPVAAVYTPPAVLPRPSAIAMLVDSLCASSCEDFVVAARQSWKVTVFSATNTAAAGDYGNIRPVMLPGWRRLRVATSRSARLRAGTQAATDFVGLPPDVRLPRGSATGDAAITFALHHLRARAPAGGTLRIPSQPPRRSRARDARSPQPLPNESLQLTRTRCASVGSSQ